MKCKLIDFQRTNKGLCIETEENIFFIDSKKGKFKENNLKKLVMGNTLLIEGIDLENECCIVGPGTITNIYANNHKPLYTAEKPRLSLLIYS